MPTSTPVQPTITAAGLAAVFNAESTGVEFAISHIAFGTGQYTPDGTETALHVEKVRVPIAGGGRISPTQIQIYAIAQATAGNPFFVGEVGFFGDSGATLLAVYSSTGTPNLFLSDTVSTSVSYALGLAALPASSVTVTIDPSASAALLIMGAHVAAADPHPQYVQKVNGVAFYDATLTFNLGAQIIGDDLLVYQSIQAANIGHAPSSSPTWWMPLYNYGDTPVAGLTNANVALSSTQAARAHITLSGALTAPLNIVFPNWVKDWTVVNNTTGAFSLTCKTAAGTGIVIPQNGSPTKIRGDGTNITQSPENVAPASSSQQAVQFGQLVGIIGQVKNLAANLATAGSSVTFTADQIIVGSALGGLLCELTSFNATLNVSGTGLNGMDTGTAPANGNIAIYAIYNPTTQAKGLLAQSVGTSVATPTYTGGNPVPGFTESALVSAVAITSTAGQISVFNQSDRDIGTGATTMLGLSAASGSTVLSVTIPIPGNAKEIKGWLNVANSTNGVLQFTLYDNLVGVGSQASGVNTTGQIGLFCSYSKLKLSTPRTTFYTLTTTSGVASVQVYFTGYSV